MTNNVGKGTKTIGINLKLSLADELERRARSMGVSKSKYVKVVLQQWVDSKKKLVLAE
jgi:metal-responsive CopG/Arc/MetJ family transcriptional regulator